MEESLQDVIDRLVIVAEEQDVLFLLVVLGQMKELGYPEQTRDGRHSWKGYSAIESISRFPTLSILHKLIIQLLLLSGAHDDINREESRNGEFTNLLLDWESSGRSEARDAQFLLSVDINDAANWIDENLPLPPNPERLTGDGPLPLPPASASQSLDINSFSPHQRLEAPVATTHSDSSLTLNPRKSTDSTFKSEKTSSPLLLHPSTESISQRSRESTTSGHSSLVSNHSPIFESVSNFLSPNSERFPLPKKLNTDRFVSLHVANLPKDFTTTKLAALFAGINVRAENCRIRPGHRTPRHIGFAEVDTSDVETCIKKIGSQWIDNWRLYCRRSRNSTLPGNSPPLLDARSIEYERRREEDSIPQRQATLSGPPYASQRPRSVSPKLRSTTFSRPNSYSHPRDNPLPYDPPRSPRPWSRYPPYSRRSPSPRSDYRRHSTESISSRSRPRKRSISPSLSRRSRSTSPSRRRRRSRSRSR